MTFKNLISTLTWPEVEVCLLHEYPSEEGAVDAYSSVFYKLRQMSEKVSDMRIVVSETFHEGIDDEPYISVSGKDGTLNKEQVDFKHYKKSVDSEFANAETSYAIEMVSWDQWLK